MKLGAIAAIVLLSGPNENNHSDSAWFSALQPLLAQSYRVYAIDRPGQAFSSSTERPSYFTFRHDIATVMQHFNERDLVVVAFSSGSISASAFYQTHKEDFNVRAMLWIDPDVPLPHSLSLYKGFPADWYRANLAQLLPHLATGAWTIAWVNERLVLSLVRRHGELPKADIARMTGLSPQTISNVMNGLEADGLLRRGSRHRRRPRPRNTRSTC